jgi:hypothetical protein
MHTDGETPTATEMRLRELLAAEGLAQPDAIERRPNELVFVWHDQKLAVVVELNDDGTPRDDARRIREPSRNAKRRLIAGVSSKRARGFEPRTPSSGAQVACTTGPRGTTRTGFSRQR